MNMALDFAAVRHQARQQWNTLHNGQRPLILVGTATCGRSAGSLEVLKVLETEIQEHDLECNIIEVGCIGLCHAEPVVCITKPSQPGICYGNIDSKKIKRLVKSYLAGDDLCPN